MKEIDKARQVAERALKSISFREEKERFNVWIALLNLENLYGNEDTLKKVLSRAQQANSPLKVSMEMAKIFAGSNKIQQAKATYEEIVTKYHQEPDCWIQYGMFAFAQDDAELAHAIMKRALERLTKKEHVTIMVKFAQLEFKHGSVDRARTVLDNVLSSYPKRVDVWNVYVDLELKTLARDGDVAAVRRLFDRIISLNLSSKKMKFFFKRYLKFEKEHGDEEHVDIVKQKAKEYVESRMNKDD